MASLKAVPFAFSEFRGNSGYITSALKTQKMIAIKKTNAIPSANLRISFYEFKMKGPKKDSKV